MKFYLTVVLILGCCLALAKSQLRDVEEESGKHIPAFVRSLKDLQRGPPVQELDNSRAKARVSTKWITQKLDNFDDANNKTWEMVRGG